MCVFCASLTRRILLAKQGAAGFAGGGAAPGGSSRRAPRGEERGRAPPPAEGESRLVGSRGACRPFLVYWLAVWGMPGGSAACGAGGGLRSKP